MSRFRRTLVWLLLVAGFAGATACIPSCNVPLHREKPAAQPDKQPPPAEPRP